MKVLRKEYLLIIYLFFFNSAYSKKIDTLDSDSLLKKAKDLYPDIISGIPMANRTYKKANVNIATTLEVKRLTLLSQFYLIKRSYDTAKFYAMHSLRIAEKHHIDSLKGDLLVTWGAIEQSQGRYLQAIEKYNEAIPFYKTRNKLNNLAVDYLNIGICKKQLSKFPEAIKYCLLSNNILESLKDNKNLSNSFKIIASCFVSLENYPKALEYNKRALAIRQLLKDTALIAQSLNNIGFAYSKYNNPDSAIYYLSKCLVMRKREKDSSILVLTLQNLGSSWKMKGNFKKAAYYISRSLRIAGNYNMQDELARGNLDFAELLLAQNKYGDGLKAVKVTEKIATTLKLPELLMDAYAIEFSFYEQSGDYKNALLFEKKRNIIKDSLFTIAKNRTINDLETHYQTNQRLKDISTLHIQNGLQVKILNQQKRFIVILIIAAFLLLLLFIFAYNSFRIKNKANERIQTLMKELHHRVKNNLEILSGLFVMQIESLQDTDARNALRENETRLASMNLIHHKLYHNHSNSQIEMQEYLEDLLYHIQESFGVNKNIRLRLEIDPVKLEADKAVAIGLIINELSTNAFKYAFDVKGGEIYLGLLQEKSKLILLLSDNGKGINNKKIENKESFGLKLVNLMAKQLHSRLIVEKGTHVAYRMEIDL